VMVQPRQIWTKTEVAFPFEYAAEFIIAPGFVSHGHQRQVGVESQPAFDHHRYAPTVL
jgi:hypothetical protein